MFNRIHLLVGALVPFRTEHHVALAGLSSQDRTQAQIALGAMVDHLLLGMLLAAPAAFSAMLCVQSALQTLSSGPPWTSDPSQPLLLVATLALGIPAGIVFRRGRRYNEHLEALLGQPGRPR